VWQQQEARTLTYSDVELDHERLPGSSEGLSLPPEAEQKRDQTNWPRNARTEHAILDLFPLPTADQSCTGKDPARSFFLITVTLHE
jgi:hypothetical protein